MLAEVDGSEKIYDLKNNLMKFRQEVFLNIVFLFKYCYVHK